MLCKFLQSFTGLQVESVQYCRGLRRRDITGRSNHDAKLGVCCSISAGCRQQLGHSLLTAGHSLHGNHVYLELKSTHQVDVPARTEHQALSGLYWLSSTTSPSYHKTRGRAATAYRRGRDWIVGYDTGEMSTVIPGLIQLGGGHQTVPSVHGWLFLSRQREWNYDSGVRVSPRWSRYTVSSWGYSHSTPPGTPSTRSRAM